MREIKFRVWDKEMNTMLEPDNQIGGLWSIKEARNGVLKYDNGVLMQYTGLKDKNGKEIYEGDICKGLMDGSMTHYSEVKFKVKFGNGAFRDTFFGRELYDDIKTIEIIGNIHENKELLGE